MRSLLLKISGKVVQHLEQNCCKCWLQGRCILVESCSKTEVWWKSNICSILCLGLLLAIRGRRLLLAGRAPIVKEHLLLLVPKTLKAVSSKTALMSHAPSYNAHLAHCCGKRKRILTRWPVPYYTVLHYTLWDALMRLSLVCRRTFRKPFRKKFLGLKEPVHLDQ